jgi:hypothetical protein
MRPKQETAENLTFMDDFALIFITLSYTIAVSRKSRISCVWVLDVSDSSSVFLSVSIFTFIFIVAPFMVKISDVCGNNDILFGVGKYGVCKLPVAADSCLSSVRNFTKSFQQYSDYRIVGLKIKRLI